MHHITINMFCKKYAVFGFFSMLAILYWTSETFLHLCLFMSDLFFSAPDIVYSGLNRCHALMAC